jgi:glycosyltransferase involved in cell wall biosynthesis
MQQAKPNLPVVVIGRNEGQRLMVCLRSVVPQTRVTVYVDSGSTDGSAAFARSLGCHVIELDPARPFGPSRARNEGFAAAIQLAPDAQFVQFLDGDCEMCEGWLQHGAATLRDRPDAGVVCGTVHEMFPDASPYNKVCEIEWQNPIGEIEACAGRMMMRIPLFRQSGGFRTDLVAGEDEEFCYRVRRSGWKVLQVDAPMARHDVAMMHLHQYWRRSRRTGFAYAQVAAILGRDEKVYSREILRMWFWGLLPLLAFGPAWSTRGYSLLLLLFYLLVIARIAMNIRRRGWSRRDARIYAWLTTASKFPGLQGMLEYYWWHLRGGRAAVSDQYYDYKIQGPQGAGVKAAAPSRPR